MSVKHLRERWADAELVARGWAVLNGESAGDDLPTVDGRIDLRGIPGPPSATAAEPWRPAWIEEVTLTGLDLSHAAFGGIRLIHVELRDCLLDRADLRGCMVRRGAWIGCRMVGIDLSQAHVSGPFLVDDCDLTRANARQSTWRDTEFSKVRLDASVLAKAGVIGCALTDVGFATADLREVGFGYNDVDHDEVSVRLTRVDLRTARLDWAMFRATLVTDCAFPTGTHLVPNWPAAVRAGLAHLQDDAATETFDQSFGLALRQRWAEETTGVILDPSPFMGDESPDGLALRVFRAAGVELIEVE